MKKTNTNFNSIKAILFLLSLSMSISVFSQKKEILLWEKIPGEIQATDYNEKIDYDTNKVAKGIRNVTQPSLTVFFADPKKSNGTSVLICPGGGYEHLSITKEGYKVAEWLNNLGINAFVLKYRLPSDLIMKDKSIGPLQDAQEALRLIRRNAEKWQLNPNEIGVLGFSAGGHLASTLCTHYDDKVYASTDTTSARPDFSILIYPVISMESAITHDGSKNNLLGTNATDEIIQKYSNEKQVTATTPIAFLVHATDDKAVPVQNSINYYLALKKLKVTAEMHLYESGGHGFGLGLKGTNEFWTKTCEKWLAANNYILNP